jgi:hypothetical protein
MPADARSPSLTRCRWMCPPSAGIPPLLPLSQIDVERARNDDGQAIDQRVDTGQGQLNPRSNLRWSHIRRLNGHHYHTCSITPCIAGSRVAL